MFSLLSPTKTIAAIAGLFAVLWGFVSSLMESADPLQALKLAAVFELLLLAFTALGWRKLWKAVPILNRLLFPDLNGRWQATINWVMGDKFGQVQGTVHIVQDFFKISLEVTTDNSESSTLAVMVKRDAESGRPILHYVYAVRPKQLQPGAEPTYEGAALLKAKHDDYGQLQGNYFTSRQTNGHFSFVRIGP